MPLVAYAPLAIMLLIVGLFVLRGRTLVLRGRQVEADLLRDATARGWTFSKSRDGHLITFQWQGTTDFTSWNAVYVWCPRRRFGHPRHCARWWAETTRGPGQPMVLLGMPMGTEGKAETGSPFDGFAARLGGDAVMNAFGTAVDWHFRAGVDAASMKPAAGATAPGFFVRSADPAEASRVLASGVQGVLSDAVRNPQSALSDNDARPWVLLESRRTTLARLTAMDTTAAVERMVRAGVAIAATQR